MALKSWLRVLIFLCITAQFGSVTAQRNSLSLFGQKLSKKTELVEAASAMAQVPVGRSNATLQTPPTLQTPTTRSGKGDGSNTTPNIIVIVVSIVVFLLAASCVGLFLRKRMKQKKKEEPKRVQVKYPLQVGEDEEQISSVEAIQYDIAQIRAATKNFSEKLGQGGFGTVYKGILEDDTKIAVKRLSESSRQGDMEFKNEVFVLARLQHKNLVKLLGFSTQGTEKLLVYQFVHNGSLNNFIFDPLKSSNLDWNTRYKIILGIAKGIQYIHEESSVQIIHRDLKPGNILLDEKMNPKISDFGLARLVSPDVTQAMTKRIIGTYGYMAPEYVSHGRFSTKSDVYSFGILVLEIVTGQRNSGDLISHAWRSWREHSSANLIEMLRCIHIALLCIQQNPEERLSIVDVVRMLSSDFSPSLPLPSEPAFYNPSSFTKKLADQEDNSGVQVKYPLQVGEAEEQISSVESIQYDIAEIQAATDNYSEKLGQGGFGTVYKGILKDGTEIAVKRLSENSCQGDTEFKNEVLVVARLQHRNLVRLLGFSTQGTEKLLVYEFVHNGSLDNFIFDPLKSSNLDWNTRYKIILGIAKGIQYIHEDSSIQIIHHDLKASNILLDKKMNPKISNFCVARLVTPDATQAMTKTAGYMAPEYASDGRFSIKSDVYSFGILVLEIVTGQRNENNSGDLISNVWRSWRERTSVNLIDPGLVAKCMAQPEMLRFIDIAMLCIQQNPEKRPSIADVVLMLSSGFSLSLPLPLPLPLPSEPAFYNPSSFPKKLAAQEDDSVVVTREPAKRETGGARKMAVNAIPVVVAVLTRCMGFHAGKRMKKKKKKEPKRVQVKYPLLDGDQVEEQISSVESIQYDIAEIQAATDNYSEKLGQGGFGTVYKGILEDGTEIAVKRLSENSCQGDMEYKNEVSVVARLQHRNLVRLLGFSTQGTEKLLVYEFVHNGSLDNFIFDPLNSSNLDWNTRYKIIGGIAKGIQYIHEESSIQIIHRDLKAGNILLDKKMNPKISNFGLARLVSPDVTQAMTKRIVGTYGYMAPEYASHGRFSIKSDVYSFGILVLEIVTEQRNESNSGDLISNAWRSWRVQTSVNLIDPGLVAKCGAQPEMSRCIHIALLCIQQNPEKRPSIADVVFMLNNDVSLSLPLPSEPAFYNPSSFTKALPPQEDDSGQILEPSAS